VVSSWREIPAAVARLRAEPGRLEAMRARLRELPSNRAVYEVLDVIASTAGITAVSGPC
jgi:UDP-N-acetylglucosamine:LPS N-acetylglucosamine transferase